MGIWNNGPSPVTTTVVLHYPIDIVAKTMNGIIRSYPRDFLKKKSNIGLGYFLFERPKGIDTPTIEVRMNAIDPHTTGVTITATTIGMSTTSADLQIDVSEVVEILSSKLRGVKNMDAVIKRNNSGNVLWGHIKSFGCLLFVIFFALWFISICVRFF